MLKHSNPSPAMDFKFWLYVSALFNLYILSRNWLHMKVSAYNFKNGMTFITFLNSIPSSTVDFKFWVYVSAVLICVYMEKIGTVYG
jgi:hypothetical protein